MAAVALLSDTSVLAISSIATRLPVLPWFPVLAVLSTWTTFALRSAEFRGFCKVGLDLFLQIDEQVRRSTKVLRKLGMLQDGADEVIHTWVWVRRAQLQLYERHVGFVTRLFACTSLFSA